MPLSALFIKNRQIILKYYYYLGNRNEYTCPSLYHSHRALTFLEKNFGSLVPEISLDAEDERLVAEISRELKSYIALQERVK